MTFEEWLEIGKTNKWASAPVCYQHTGIKLTASEADKLDEDEDAVCIAIMRVYKTTKEFDEAEKTNG